MGPVHEGKLPKQFPCYVNGNAEMVTPVTQKSCHIWQDPFEVWESRASVRLHLVHKWAGPKSLIG